MDKSSIAHNIRRKTLLQHFIEEGAYFLHFTFIAQAMNTLRICYNIWDDPIFHHCSIKPESLI